MPGAIVYRGPLPHLVKRLWLPLRLLVAYVWYLIVISRADYAP
jgi:hypothetical protein